MSTKLFLNTGRETIKGGALHALKDAGNAGAYDFNVLTLTGDVVDQETFELGSDVYEINSILTDTGAESTVQIEVGDTSIIFDTQPTIPLLPGDVIRMEVEFMIVLDYNVNGTGSANVIRGAFGSTEAQHTTANSDTFQAAQPVVAGNFAVPVSAVVETTADGQIIGAVQFWTDGGYSKGLGGGIGVKVQNSLKVDATQGAGTTVAFGYPADGGVASALATDMTNATMPVVFAGGVEEAGQVYSKIVFKAAGTGAVSFFAPWAVDEAYVTIWGADGAIIEAAANTVTVSGRLVTVSAAGSLAAGVLVEVTILAA
jgi:hypothetical protein